MVTSRGSLPSPPGNIRCRRVSTIFSNWAILWFTEFLLLVFFSLFTGLFPFPPLIARNGRHVGKLDDALPDILGDALVALLKVVDCFLDLLFLYAFDGDGPSAAFTRMQDPQNQG